MTRITINNTILPAALALAALAMLGCSEQYAPNRLDADSPEAKQVVTLIAGLRQAGPDAIDQTVSNQAKDGLTEQELKSLRFGLDKIVAADTVALRKIERFGDQVYRVVLSLETDGGTESLAMLLTGGDDDKLRWIGVN
jgi:hypothetical protein